MGTGVTSVVLAIALIAGLLIPLTGAPGPAQAEAGEIEPGIEQVAELLGEDLLLPEPQPPVSNDPPAIMKAAPPTGGFVVNSLGDLDDAIPGDAFCADSAGQCTLRAAITEANEWPGPTRDVTFSLGGTIALSAPLEARVPVSINGGANRVTIDGGSTVQLLRFTEAVPEFSVRSLTLSNGHSEGNGGAVESSATSGTIDSVTFVSNSSTAAGGAVVVRKGAVDFRNTTFWQNSAPQGADIANIDGTVGVNFSTFVPATGGSLHNAVERNRFTVYFSLIAGECTEVAGGANHAADGCPRMDERPVSGLGTFGDHGGVVQTVSLDYLSPAVDAYFGGEEGGEGGARVDARGVERPQGATMRLDFGAFELEGGGPPPPADGGPWPSSIEVTAAGGSATDFGEAVTFTATVRPDRPSTAPADSPDPTGSVVFLVNGVPLPAVPLSGGLASVTIDTLPVGTNEIRAEYSGDVNYIAPPPSYRVLQMVAPISTTVVLSTSPTSTVTGQQVTLTAVVAADTSGGPALSGVVAFWVSVEGSSYGTHLGDVEVDASGTASISTAGFGTGTRLVTAYFSPATSDYLESEGAINQVVAAAATQMVLSTSASEPVYGESVTFIATVAPVSPATGVPAGAIEFTVGTSTISRPLDAGVARYTTDALDLGTNTMTARYVPAASATPAYMTSWDALDVEIGKAQSAITVSVTPAPSALGQEVTVRVDLTTVAPGGGTPSGTVEFRVGSDVLGTATLSAGVATITTDQLPLGVPQIAVAYEGDANHLPSTVDHEHRVTPIATTVNLTTSSSTAVTGQVVQYTARVAHTGPGTATLSGTVTFSGLVNATVRLAADGTAVLNASIPPSSQSSATVVATFEPEDAASAGSAGFVTQQLSPASVTVSASVPVDPVTLGALLHVTVDVTGNSPSATRPASGNIVVSEAGRVLATVPVSSFGPTVVSLATKDGLGVGSHDLSVVYRNGIGYRDGVDTITARVAPVVAEVHLVAVPGTSEYGNPVELTAVVSAPFGLEPSGVVSIYDGSVLVHSSFIARTESGWGVTFQTGDLSVGQHQLRAEFSSWNASLASSTTEQDLEFTVHPVDTATQLVLGPQLVGTPLSWTVLVRATRDGYRPTGSVQLTIGGQTLPPATLEADPNSTSYSVATVVAPVSLPLPIGTHPIVADYLPSGVFAASTDSDEQSIVSYLPSVTVSTRSTPGSGPWLSAMRGVAWGEPVEVRAQLSSSAGQNAPQPTGKIVFDGASEGVSCTVNAPSQSCVLVWPEAGTFALTARYEGDLHYGQESSAPQNVTIDRKTPVFSRVGVQESPVVTGEPVTAYWEIAGPAAGEGTVRVDFGAVPGCTVAGTHGSCASAYGLGLAGQAQRVTVHYPQSSRWNAISHSVQVTPLGCYPLEHQAAEGGTLVVLTPPNCNGGTGYLDNTSVWVRPAVLPHATAGHSWRFAGFSPALAGSGPDYVLTAGAGAGKTTRIVAQFSLEINCVTVRVTPQFSTTTAQLRTLGAPNCPVPDALHREVGKWHHGGSGGYIGRFLVGSEVNTEVFLGGVEDVVYGYRWDSAIAPVETRRSAESFIAERDTHVWVLAGPRCYAIDVARTGPGTVKTSADSPRCHNPAEPAGEWPAGTNLEFTATPDSTKLAYVDGWNGFDPGLTKTFVSNQESNKRQSGEVASYSVVAGQDAVSLGVHFASCRRLSIDPVTQDQAEGTVEVFPTHNCEVSPEQTGLFMEGSEVSLRAVPNDARNIYRAAFGKWNLDDAMDADAERTLVMDRDITLHPSFYRMMGDRCIPVTVQSGNSAQVQVDMTQTSFDDDQICHHGTLGTGPGESFAGSFNTALEPVLRLHSELLQVDSLIGWELDVAGKGSLGQLGANLEISGLRSAITATAHACQAIEPLVALRMESGNVITERPEAGSELIMTRPAPNCPYAEDAWLVGTTVELAALGDPAGYRFTGWSGVVRGVGLTNTVQLDGSTPSVTVTASYDVTCYALTLTHDKKDVTAYPAPNCRGTDPELGRYIGGSTVSMYGEVPGGKIWQGWTGDVVQTGKVNPAFVIMDDDKSAGHRWRSKSWDEELVGGLEWFGDQIAIAAKKAVGVIALTVKELAGSALAAVPPFSVLATIGPALSLVGTILELAGVSENITKYLHFANETFDWMLSTFSCAASWSFASSGGGGAGSGESEAEEIARAGLDGYDAASTAKDTAGLVVDARKAYFGVAQAAAKGTSKAAAAGGFALTVGLDVAATIMETGIGWETDAASAWTDGTVFTDCMGSSVPSYMHDVIGEIDKVGV